jgi:SAM-dependent methyltransferase
MDRKAHWEKIYTTRSHKEVSWFAEHVNASLELIRESGVPKRGAFIDIGGGASTLVDDLLEEGWSDLTVLDISGAALEIARMRLGPLASSVRWLEEDLLASDLLGRRFDLWHDRAVFHFLTEEPDRERYRAQVEAHLAPGGAVILSVFAEDGPEKCSGLVIRRHGEGDIEAFFGPGFRKVGARKTVHVTPAGAEQRFVNVILRREAAGRTR